MPRSIRSAQLETRTARLKLTPRRKPFWISVAPGISLGYRAGPGSWNVRAADGNGGNWIQSFAIADDHEQANGETVLDFWQATERARKLARGQDASDSAARPVTVADALNDYRADLIARDGNPANATGLRIHIPASLLAKPVALTTAKEWRSVRDTMRTRVKGSSVNRNCKSLKAALNLAGKLDARVANQAAWRDGLSAVAENDSEESNIVLTDAQVRAVVAAAYTAVGAAFGLYAEVHAVTGARSSQIAHLNVDDLQMGAAPRLMVPSSLKGGRTQRTRTPVPIPLDLALRLSKLAAGRPARAPLLRDQSGDRWQPGKITYRCFADAVTAAGLVDDEGQPVASIYALRHTAITRMLLANKPVRVVAANFDTSVPMIEKTYSKLIAHHSDNLLRDAVIDLAAPAGGTVVALRSA